MVWIELHPHWAGLGVLLLAFLESLAVIGLFVPGTAVMFAVGALVGTGALDLWSTLAWAVVGAITGDSLGYWLGVHYHESLRGLWPFKRHPEWLTRGERYSRRHE